MNFYRLLLHLYPSSYRAEYGDEMSAIFTLELRRSSGLASGCGLWLAAFTEVFSNAAVVHWEIATRDFRYSLRSLFRSPGFAITAFLLITIGIGANAAIFTLADYVLVRPLPFPDPQRLVKVWEKHPGYSMMELSPANYRDFKAATTSLASLAAYNDMAMNLVGQGEPQRVEGAWVTGNLFSTLGRATLLGRSFSDGDDQTGAPATVVLSYALWQSDFGGDASVLGKSVILDDRAYTVIGVMPADFHFPTRETQFWKTLQFQEDNYKDRNDNYLVGIGRLKPGVSLESGAHRADPDRRPAAAAISQGERERRRVRCSRCATNSPPSLDFAHGIVWSSAVRAGDHLRQSGQSSAGAFPGAAEGTLHSGVAGRQPPLYSAATAF